MAAVDARGYLFGAPLAYKLGCGLVLIRKEGKLPAATIKETYDLEYGTATLEVHKDAIEKNERVVLIDDVLATGGTTRAACKLLQQLGANIVSALFLIELKQLNGRKIVEKHTKTISLIKC